MPIAAAIKGTDNTRIPVGTLSSSDLSELLPPVLPVTLPALPVFPVFPVFPVLSITTSGGAEFVPLFVPVSGGGAVVSDEGGVTAVVPL